MSDMLFKPIKFFRFRSSFVTILVLMLSLCMGMCLAFSVLFTNTIIDDTKEHQAQVNDTYVETLIGNTEYQINNLHHSLTQLSYSRTVSPLIYYQKPTSNAIHQLMVDIALAQDNNQMVERITVYIPAIDRVITSDYSDCTMEESSQSQMIYSYEAGQVDAVTIENGGNKSSLFFYGKNLLMARDFPLSGRDKLATIYYTLDKEEIYRHLTGQLLKGTELWVYTADGKPVFEDVLDYPEDITLEELRLMESDELQMRGIFIGISSALGWNYVYILDDVLVLPSVMDVFVAICPVILGILVISCVISLVIASHFYKPVYRMFRILESQGYDLKKASPQIKNELDYLGHTFSELLGHQSELDVIVRNTSTDIMKRFFVDRLAGKQISYENAKEILNNAQSEFKANAYYTVCVVCLLKAEKCDQNGGQIVIEGIREVLHELYREYQVLSHIVESNEGCYAVILSFEDHISYLKIQKILVELENMVEGFFKRKGDVIRFGKGQLYHSILDIGFAYNEALEVLSLNEENKDEGEADIKAEHSYTERAKQVFALASEEDVAGACTLAIRIIDDIGSKYMSFDDQIQHCKSFVSSLLEQIARLEFIDLSLFPNELLTIDNGIPDKESLVDMTKQCCMSILNQLDEMQKKQKNRYLVAAKQYIASHYSDDGLSLNSVAEAINVNPSYLSKLFTGNLGINFTSYLNKYRIDISMELLAKTEYPVKEIAVRCGFSSVQNYIRVFKKYAGKTPGQYREKVK